MMATSAPINRPSFEEHFKGDLILADVVSQDISSKSNPDTETRPAEHLKDTQRRDSKCDVDISSEKSLKLEPTEQDIKHPVESILVDEFSDSQPDSPVVFTETSTPQSENGVTDTTEDILLGKENKMESSSKSSETLLTTKDTDASSQISASSFATADGDLPEKDETSSVQMEPIEHISEPIIVPEDSFEEPAAPSIVPEKPQPDQIFKPTAEVIMTSSPEMAAQPNEIHEQVEQTPPEDVELKREDNSAVGMFRRFTSTFSLRSARGTFGSRESLRNIPVPSNAGNRDSGKSSLSDGSSGSDQAVTTPTGVYSRDIPDSFSMLDDTSSIRSSVTVDLLVARAEAHNKVFGPKSPVAHLRSGSFSRLKGLIDEEAEANIDWEFWGNLISDYPGMVRKQSRLVSKNIQSGIPASLRGSIWQLISKSKDSPLEILYNQLLEQTSSFDKMITRDLSRTFPNHEFFQSDGGGQESLYNVVKAFSLYDTDVGYCQGIPFIVGPLLLHMPEEEAFCVLVRLMRAYGLRGHFTPQLETLHLRLYQFDHLLEEYLPILNKHMVAEGVTSTMYASQWFMTLFAYRFPLPLVFRIFDIIFAEGVESLLRFAIALLKANHEKLIEMPFETLLDFLKHHLYEIYEGKIDQLISDAYDVKITTKRLDRLSRDYYTELKKQQAEVNHAESLKNSNKRLEEDVKRLENNVQTLNEEHCELANEFVQCKLDIAHLQDENESLKFEVAQLKEQLGESRKEAEQSVTQEMELLAHKNFELADRNTRLEDQLSELEAQLIETKMRYAESENERVQLQKKWDDLRRAFH
ncbi:GTPase-activating protein [Basidiobolus ranarum]|uniref:GTPase-activating protein n=1 Tax=Basidiobolus ranarum TaxID=34480 RepID=A0ABR2WUT9_9FUNG